MKDETKLSDRLKTHFICRPELGSSNVRFFRMVSYFFRTSETPLPLQCVMYWPVSGRISRTPRFRIRWRKFQTSDWKKKTSFWVDQSIFHFGMFLNLKSSVLWQLCLKRKCNFFLKVISELVLFCFHYKNKTSSFVINNIHSLERLFLSHFCQILILQTHFCFKCNYSLLCDVQFNELSHAEFILLFF